uniref:Uncharacterized protein n=1 Tax=Utricularia reniformis TaxID=192314 RepID=A0A1Y0B4E5_9LAMI|nr:hypothetical protein AEK19_MT2110 [Utricularia reniformis]ART32263.1 hypothetical protein AEK19_MT2110 [Utricularia reniformis]
MEGLFPGFSLGLASLLWGYAYFSRIITRLYLSGIKKRKGSHIQ